MLLLTSASDLVRVITGSASDIEVHASWVDNLSGAITPGRTNTASITTATTTTVVASPASSTQRNVKLLSVRNNHASVATLVTVDHTDGTNAETLIKVLLLPGETLLRDYIGKWTHYAANGQRYGPMFPMATQAEMETATAVDRTVNPAVQHYHPGHPKCWGKVTVSGGTPTLQTSYNITSITDTAQGRITFTIATDFSSADWCCQAQVERAATALTNANLRYVNIESAGQAAGTVLLECGTGKPNATDETLEDPAGWSMVGLGDHA